MCYKPICQNDQAIKEQCSLVISHMPYTYIPIAVTSNPWIIPSNPHTWGSTMRMTCQDKAISTVHLQQPFHILRLSPACSATSNYFYLPPHHEDHSMLMNVSLDTVNIITINTSILNFRIECGNILAEIELNPTCRGWQIFLKYQSHSCTEIWSMPVNQSTHLSAKMMMKMHPSYG